MEVNEFDAIRISLASPDQILEWSHGEVTKPETINYRTLRPERDGLFCERIFGPQRDWECACGKYKRTRYKGIICDKCGVEVAHSRVRRERMGHIKLASPVSHIWYVKGVPSRLGLLLNVSPRNLERVIYFATYIITHVDEDARNRTITRQEKDLNMRAARIEGEVQSKIDHAEAERTARLADLDSQEEAERASLAERLAAETSEVIATGQKLQASLEKIQGKPAAEAVVLPWQEIEAPLVPAGATVTREHLSALNDAIQSRLSEIEDTINREQEAVRNLIAARRELVRREAEQAIDGHRQAVELEKQRLRTGQNQALEELKGLRERDLLSESEYRDLTERWGNCFKAAMGAEAIRDLVGKIDLEAMVKELRVEINTTQSKQRKRKAAKRLRVAESFRKSGNHPEWMILTLLPVLPPELRPMVQLDGGRFATSDLNDLYRRVINRNNRLKRLLELGAPDVIVRNEKRMLQEAVDSLIDNGRRGRAVSRSGKRKLKSLSDLLKGKQGRFRRNLLGKRVDYSGRSVIVIGPELKLDQCGLPKKMALELFKPFVMRRLVEYNYAHNIKSAKRLVDRESPEVWDVLEEVTKERPVLLNRAPTLHRLGIQAFEVMLIEGSAIQIHPLVCAAFNADFDGDQMAVHVPLSDAAVTEARELMLSSVNLLKPSSGEPIVGPSKDMVLGCYYLTVAAPNAKGAGKAFSDADEVRLAYDLGVVDLRAPVRVRFVDWADEVPLADLELEAEVTAALEKAKIRTAGDIVRALQNNRALLVDDLAFSVRTLEDIRSRLLANHVRPDKLPQTGMIETTVGRILFNNSLPRPLQFVNDVMDKKRLSDFVGVCYELMGSKVTAEVVDEIKRLGFTYATISGMTIAVSDITVPASKQAVMDETTAKVEETERQYRRGLITEEEQYNKVVELWSRATDEITQAVKDLLDPMQGLGAMATSGATKGGIQPIRQLAGMRGLMADPSGRIIALPIRSNFREGLTALEYFLSTHGARKGLADTALRTADAGYLTRRLVDVAQDVIITSDDCGTEAGIWFSKASEPITGEKLTRAHRRPHPGGQRRRTHDRRVAAGARAGRRRDGAGRHQARERREGVRPLAADVRESFRPVQAVLRHGSGPRRHGADGRGGGHHRGAVDRRARHAAHAAHVPHRRCGGRRGHHPGSAPRRGVVRGPHAQGRGRHQRDRRHRGRVLGRGRQEAQGDQRAPAPQDAHDPGRLRDVGPQRGSGPGEHRDRPGVRPGHRAAGVPGRDGWQHLHRAGAGGRLQGGHPPRGRGRVGGRHPGLGPPAGGQGRPRRSGDAAHRGFQEPTRGAAHPGPRDRADVPAGRSAEGLPLAGCEHPRQAHRGDHPPIAAPGARAAQR